MAFDALAIVAAALIGFAEALAFSNLRLASILGGIALVFLLFASRVAYLLIFVLLAALAGCGVFLYRLPAKDRDPRSNGLRGAVLGKHAPRWVAGLIHLFGLWLLPVCIMWGVLDVYGKELFYSEEIGHQLPATQYMLFFVITPLLLMPAGYEKGELKHQLYESVVLIVAATIYYMCFRIAHFHEGRNPPNLTGTLVQCTVVHVTLLISSFPTVLLLTCLFPTDYCSFGLGS